MSKYGFISHESAVEAIWWIVRNGTHLLDDENIWALPDSQSCVTTQSEFDKLAQEVKLASFGVVSRPVHLLCPSASSRSRGMGATMHVWSDYFPDHAFYRVHERVFISSPFFVALQLALAPRPSRISRTRAASQAEENNAALVQLGLEGLDVTPADLLMWERTARTVRAVQVLTDFAGTYRFPTKAGQAMLYGQPRLMTHRSLREFVDKSLGARGAKKVRTILDYAFEGSASPMETALAIMLTPPVEMGGYGLPRPEMNAQVFCNPALRALSPKDELFSDLVWRGDRQSADTLLEFSGRDKHYMLGPKKLADDFERANALTALGITC